MSPTREALFTLLEAARVQSRAIRDLCKIVSDLQQQISNPTLVAEATVTPVGITERRALPARRRLRQHRTLH